MFKNIFFFENRAVYGIIWKNIDGNMAHAHCMLRATNTHSRNM